MNANIITIRQGNISEAIDIMTEAAQWLIQTGRPLWSLDELTKEKLLKRNKEEDFHLCHLDGNAISAMILKWHDPFFWPDIEEGASGSYTN